MKILIIFLNRDEDEQSSNI